MRILIQRALKASVSVGGNEISHIGRGMMILVGVAENDTAEDVDWLVKKSAGLRIFDDEAGIMNLDIMQTGGEVMAVSQFTLLAATKKGNRPSYIRAAKEDIAVPLYERFVAGLRDTLGKEIATGIFGAEMQVELTNDGPVTIWIDSQNRE